MSPPLSARSVSADSRTNSDSSLFALLFSGVLGVWLLAAPSVACNHPPTDYNYWPTAMALLCLAVVGLFGALDQEARFRLDAIGIGILLFCGWNLLATFFGVYKHDSWLEMARVTGALFLYFALRAFPGRLTAMTLCAVAGAFIPAVLAVAAYFPSHNPQQQAGFVNPNFFAALLAPCLMLSPLVPALIKRRTNSVGAVVVGFVPFAVLALALALTSSKGGFLAALVAMGVLLGATFRAKSSAFKRVLKKSWPVLLVLALAFGLVAARTVGKRLAQARGGDENSTQFRVYLWRSTLQMAQAHPVLGVGPGNFVSVYPNYAQVGFTRTAHQTWLQIAAEGGWPALALLLGTFALAAGAGWRKLRTAQWVQGACGLAALCAMLVHGFFDSGLTVLANLALVSVALALCAPEPKSQAESEERRGLNWPFLGATVVLLLAGYGTQKVAGGEDLRAQDEARLQNGQAPNQASAAVATDPGSARAWNFLGRMTAPDDRSTWTTAFENAMRLQPTSGMHPLDMARQIDRLPSPTADDLKQISSLYDRAVELDPLNTTNRLERAKWRLAHKDERGNDDLEYIVRERDEPYGKYPALDRNRSINLDYARATVALAPHLKATGQQQRLAPLVQSALQDCADARALATTYGVSLEELSSMGGVGNYRDVDEIESQLKALK